MSWGLIEQCCSASSAVESLDNEIWRPAMGEITSICKVISLNGCSGE